MLSVTEVKVGSSSGNTASWASRSAVDVLRAEVQYFLSGLVGEEVKFYPNTGNAGDSLIAVGTFHCFDRLGLRYKQLYPSDEASTGTIIFGGGGNLIQRYDFIRRGLLKHLDSADRIIILPHTIRSNEDLLAKMDHRVTIFCRDITSYFHCKKYTTGADVFLGHDMAFHADVVEILNNPESKQRYDQEFEKQTSQFPKYLLKTRKQETVYFLRTDCEKLHYELESDIDVSHVFLGEVSRRDSVDQSVWYFLSAIARCSALVTDRLHVAIAASLLGIPCKIFDNNYGKNSDVYGLSLQGQFPGTVFADDISTIANPFPVRSIQPVMQPRLPLAEKKMALLYCVTRQPVLRERLLGSIEAQRQIETQTGIRCPYTKVLITDGSATELSTKVLDFFDYFVCGVSAFEDDPYVGRQYLSLSRMRNAALRYAAQNGFDWVLLCNSDTVVADYRLEPPDSGFGVPEVYWQKNPSEGVLFSLAKTRNPDENTFSKGNSWFLISSSIFRSTMFNENIYGYGFEDMEYEARVLAGGARNTTTAMRVIHKYHPDSQRGIDRYCHERNRTIFEYVRHTLKAGDAIDVSQPMSAFPAEHKNWQGALILLPESNTVVQWNQLSKGKYELDGGKLTIEWERFPRESSS